MNKKLRIAPFLPFYCFKQTFLCVENLETELESIAAEVYSCVEVAKESSWFEFWQSQGNEIVLRLWKIKYKDYIDDTFNEEVHLNKELVDEEAVTKEKLSPKDTSFEAFSLNDEINALSWQTLWDQHSAEVYADQYKKFEDIFESYFWILKEALNNHVDEISSKNNYLHEWKKDFEQLKLAGLPTSFGNKKGSKQKKKFKSKKQEKEEEEDNFYELSEADFNENEDDIYFSATDNSDNEFEMPPVKSPNESFEQKNDDYLHNTFNKSISKTKKNRMLRSAPAFMQEEKEMQKYWRQRFSLFSRFDEGIQLDRESWFSVTPEKVAQHMARRMMRDLSANSNIGDEGLTIVDGFCGCGGNTIQFAMFCNKVIAIDIDPMKIEMAKHNAEIYGVANKIEFIVGDFLQVSQQGNLKADAVFLSPPWGGPLYKSVETYNIETCLEPVSASELMRVSRHISDNIAFFLPRNADIKQIIRLAGVGNACEIEHNYLDTRVVGLTAFYGECVAKQFEQH